MSRVTLPVPIQRLLPLAAIAAALVVLGSVQPGHSRFTSTTAAPDNRFDMASRFKPRNLTAPSISGTAQEGRQLHADPGTWSNEPTGYTYQWKRCDAAGEHCDAIADATERDYTATSDDVGQRLRVTVRATNEAGASKPKPSPATAAVLIAAPENTAPPTLSGVAKAGETITVDYGTWTKEPTGYTVAWERCDTAGEHCDEIPDATGDAYTLTDGDVGSRVRARVTATNDGGSTHARSEPTATVDSAIPAPANTSPPTISGSPQRLSTLTVTTGTWEPEPTGYAYQWQRCSAAGDGCADIDEATSQSYTVTAADVGFTLRAIVTASNETASAQAASAVTAKVTEQTAPTVTITSVPAGNSPSGQIAFDVGGQTTSVTCKIDSATPTDCTSPKSVSVSHGATHVVTVTATNPAGSTSKTATWVNTSSYVSQGYWHYPPPVNWGYYEDCPGCGAYDHWYYPPPQWIDTSYWSYSGYWRIDP